MNSAPITIYVPRDSTALALGADETATEIRAEAERRGIAINLVRNGSRGMFWLEPMVEVASPRGRIAFGPVEASDVASLFDAGFADVSFPDDGELKHLMTDYKTHETEQLSQQQEQSTRAVFDADCQKLAVARFFEPHEFVTSKKSPDDFKTELVRLYADEAPKAKVTVDRMPQPGVHEILFEQASPNPLEMARREMMVVIGKGKNDQTLVLFKNFEYQRRMNGNTLNIVIGGSMEDNWVPLHSSQVQMTPAYEEQVKVGYRMMMRKVMKAVGETFVYTPN